MTCSVTGDETRVFTPEMKWKRMVWKTISKSLPNKVKATHSAGKVKATVFLDAEGVLLIDYLPSKVTINTRDRSMTILV